MENTSFLDDIGLENLINLEEFTFSLQKLNIT